MDYIKKFKDMVDEGVKGEKHSALQDCLTNGYISRREKMRSLIFGGQQSKYPILYSRDMNPNFLVESLETQSSDAY